MIMIGAIAVRSILTLQQDNSSIHTVQILVCLSTALILLFYTQWGPQEVSHKGTSIHCMGSNLITSYRLY